MAPLDHTSVDVLNAHATLILSWIAFYLNLVFRFPILVPTTGPHISHVMPGWMIPQVLPYAVLFNDVFLGFSSCQRDRIMSGLPGALLPMDRDH